jgi:hypothetical protein
MLRRLLRAMLRSCGAIRNGMLILLMKAYHRLFGAVREHGHPTGTGESDNEDKDREGSKGRRRYHTVPRCCAYLYSINGRHGRIISTEPQTRAEQALTSGTKSQISAECSDHNSLIFLQRLSFNVLPMARHRSLVFLGGGSHSYMILSCFHRYLCYLCYLLGAPTTDPGLLDFAACQKKHLRHCVMGCFTTAESLYGCHSLPQHDNQSNSGPKIGGDEVCIFHIPRNNFLQKSLCAKDKGHSNDTFGNRFEVH